MVDFLRPTRWQGKGISSQSRVTLATTLIGEIQLGDNVLQAKNTSMTYPKFKTPGESLMDNVWKAIDSGKLELVGQGTLKKGQALMNFRAQKFK